MKSPYRFNWRRAIFYVIAVTLLLVAILFLLSHNNSVLFLQRLSDPIVHYVLIFVILLILFDGFLLGNNRDLLHRKVNHPIDAWHIDYGRTYWLNGETESQYTGTHKYTGKMGFDINGVNGIHYFIPGKVAEYFSENQEVFPKKK